MLTGERVLLRPFRPDDVEPLWTARLDPLYWAQTTEQPYVAQSLDDYRRRYTAPSTDSSAQFAVEAEGRLVGRAGLFAVEELARLCEVGLSLLPGERGKGYGSDALRVLVAFAFRTRNLRRVHLQTLASNEAALHAYRAVGFVEEGRQREHAWVEGSYDDVVRMGLLRDEWSGQTSSPSR